MNNIFANEKAVSPVVATLVLVVVAIIGAAAVGTILGVFSSEVSEQANAGDTEGASSAELLVAGSTTVLPVSEYIADAYEKKNHGVIVTVSGGGSGAGIAGAGLGSVDIGSASRFLEDEEREKFPELEEHVIGGSAVVVIRNNDAAFTVTKISQGELEVLYNNDNTETPTIDGAAIPTGLVVYQRSEDSGTEETFAKFATGNSSLDGANADAGVTHDKAEKNQGVLNAVKNSDDPAIGFVDYGYAKDDDDVTILDIEYDHDGDGTDTIFTADETEIKNSLKERLEGKTATTSTGDYVVELCRPLIYLTNGDGSAIVNDYITFASSPISIPSFHSAGYWSITELQ